jgi:pimeloyl-ACP methyl ester carboxylesterase
VPFAAVNGQQVWYQDSGGPRPAILFAHAFGMDSSSLHRQVELLSREFRCVRWDARGFGNTVTDGAEFDFWQQAADGTALLAHLGIDSAIWLGLSQGGFIALRAALRHPERVSALILIDTMAGIDDDQSREAKARFMGRWAEQGLTPKFISGFLRTTLGPEVEPPPGLVESMHLIEPTALGQALRCMLGRETLADRLSEITVPALVIHGECDGTIPLARAEQMRQALAADAPLIVIPSAGHCACVSHPDLIYPHVARFARSVLTVGVDG